MFRDEYGNGATVVIFDIGCSGCNSWQLHTCPCKYFIMTHLILKSLKCSGRVGPHSQRPVHVVVGTTKMPQRVSAMNVSALSLSRVCHLPFIINKLPVFFHLTRG